MITKTLFIAFIGLFSTLAFVTPASAEDNESAHHHRHHHRHHHHTNEDRHDEDRGR